MNINYHLKSDRRTTPFDPVREGVVRGGEALPFGKVRTDHVFEMDYSADKGWHNARIVPYGPDQAMWGATERNYGIQVFEGGKAFRHEGGRIVLFRPRKHAYRFQISADLLCMPKLPKDMFVDAMKALVDVDRLWYPEGEGSSLYVRPVMIGTEDIVSVTEGSTFRFGVFLSPGGPYYAKGFNPITLLVTDRFHRAAPGGLGRAKTGANYAASIRAKHYAAQFDAQQVLYLDVFNRTLEEAGAMNHFHHLRGSEGSNSVVEIPTYTNTILRGVTSQSFLKRGEEWTGVPFRQRKIPLNEFIDRLRAGEIDEAGGLGTAAVVSPVGEYVLDVRRYRRGRHGDLERITVGDGKAGPVSRAMYQALTDIQMGRRPAPRGWLVEVERRAA